MFLLETGAKIKQEQERNKSHAVHTMTWSAHHRNTKGGLGCRLDFQQPVIRSVGLQRLRCRHTPDQASIRVQPSVSDSPCARFFFSRQILSRLASVSSIQPHVAKRDIVNIYTVWCGSASHHHFCTVAKSGWQHLASHVLVTINGIV